MISRAARYGGPIPALRHGFRVGLNRIWSLILKGGLYEGGAGFNVDFTTRILGAYAVACGSRFHAARGLKIVIAHPNPVLPLVRIGNGVCINEFVTIAAYSPVVIGDNVLIGSRVYIGTVDHGHYRGEHPSDPDSPPNSRPLTGSGETVIEANVWIGEGAILPKGVRIGFGAVVAAGAVVTHAVPPRVVVAGNPASIVRGFDAAQNRWFRSGAAISTP